jgi:hypothetical protein
VTLWKIPALYPVYPSNEELLSPQLLQLYSCGTYTTLTKCSNCNKRNNRSVNTCIFRGTRVLIRRQNTWHFGGYYAPIKEFRTPSKTSHEHHQLDELLYPVFPLTPFSDESDFFFQLTDFYSRQLFSSRSILQFDDTVFTALFGCQNNTPKKAGRKYYHLPFPMSNAFSISTDVQKKIHEIFESKKSFMFQKANMRLSNYIPVVRWMATLVRKTLDQPYTEEKDWDFVEWCVGNVLITLYILNAIIGLLQCILCSYVQVQMCV